MTRYGVAFIVDAQIHPWEWPTGRVPYVDAGPGHQKPYPVNAEAILFQMDLAGVSRCYLVPPSWTGRSNVVALDAARRYPDRFAVVGLVDYMDPTAPERMPTWKRQPGMMGLRTFIYSREEQEALRSGKLDKLFQAAAEAGVPVNVMIPGLADAIALVERIVERNPGLKVQVDHMNLRAPEDLKDVAPSLMRLAKYPNVAVKTTCLPYVSRQPYPFRDVHDTLERAFDSFGPSRMFWGSDLSRSPCSYPDHITLFTHELPWLKGDDLALVMGGAVTQWMGWPA